MGRRPRILLAGGIYHVYNRVSRGEHVFRDEDEADRFEALLAATKKTGRLSDPRLLRDVELLPSRGTNGGGVAVAIDGVYPTSVFAESQRPAPSVRPILAGPLPVEVGRGGGVSEAAHRLHSPQSGHGRCGEGRGKISVVWSPGGGWKGCRAPAGRCR